MNDCGFVNNGCQNQLWTFNQQNYTITSKATGHCLTLHPSGRHNVGAAPCTPENQPFQTWILRRSSESGIAQIVAALSDIRGDDTRACLAAANTVRPGALEIWAGPLTGSRQVVVLFNRNVDHATDISLDLKLLGLDSAVVRDLWEQKDLGVFQSSFTASVQPHDVKMLLVKPQAFVV